jgi:hypothetical protein
MDLTQSQLAKELAIPRRTISHYQSLGMPKNLEGASEWLTQYKAGKFPGVAALAIESTPAVDGSFDARLECLRGEEMQLAGEIEATRGELEKLVAEIGVGPVEEIAKKQVVLHNRLERLRKQHLATSKALAEIEQRRLQLSKDVVSVSALHDALVRHGAMFSKHCRHVCDTHPEHAAVANYIVAEWERSLMLLTEELKGENDDRRDEE